MTTTMPEDVFFGKVVFRAIRAIADTSDPDRQPDATPATGYVLFTPATNPLKALTPGPTTVVKDQIRCNLGADGYMMDDQDAEGVWLVAGDYKVTYAIDDAVLEGHTIRVTEEYDDEAPLDLTTAIEPSGSLNVSQYQQLLALIQASGIPDAPINGAMHVRQDGSWVVLPDVDLSAYSTTVETESAIAQAISEIVFPETGVPEAPQDGGAYLRKSATWVPLLGEVSGASYRGVWDSTTVYKAGDTVLSGGRYWGANLDNSNSIPSDGVTYTLTGEDGSRTGYYWDQVASSAANKEILHPIRVNKPVRLGGVRIAMAVDGGHIPWPTAISIGLTDTLPVGTSALPLIIPPNIAVPIPAGGNNFDLIFDNPINLEPNKDYWVWMRAEGSSSFGRLTVNWGGYAYSGDMILPETNTSGQVRTYARDDGQVWASPATASVNRHTNMGILTASLVEWDLLSYDPYQLESPDKSVESIVKMLEIDYAALATKNPKTIYLVDDQIYLGDQLLAPGVVGEAPEDGTPYARQDAAWEAIPPTIAEAPAGGLTGQALVKLSDTDGDATWRSVHKFRGTWTGLPYGPQFSGWTSATSSSATDPANLFNSTGYNWSGYHPVWVRVDMAVARTMGFYRLGSIGASSAPSAWVVEGSNDDGATGWTVVDTRSTVTWASNEDKYFTIAVPQAFRYWRVRTTAAQGGAWANMRNFAFWEPNTDPTVAGDTFVYGGKLHIANVNSPSETPGSGSQFSLVDLSGYSSDKALKTQVVSDKTAAYTLVAGDQGSLLVFNSATDVNVSVPTDANMTFPIGGRIDVLTKGVGLVTAVAVTPGTTNVSGTPSTKTRATYSAMSLIKIAANTWVVVGDTA